MFWCALLFQVNGKGFMVVGSNLPASGTLRSAGSVRAASGAPMQGPSSDVGFAFDEWGHSGVFLTSPGGEPGNSSSSSLSMQFLGSPLLILPGNSSMAATLSSSLHIQDGTLFLGPDALPAVRLQDNVLQLNPMGPITGGLRLGRPTDVSIEFGTSSVDVSIGSIGSSLATLNVSGSLLGAEGIPSTASPSGFAFQGFPGTGMFASSNGLCSPSQLVSSVLCGCSSHCIRPFTEPCLGVSIML